MGCPYCYLAVRLRLPCPCSLYHTTASLNSASSSPPLASVSANLQTNTEMVRETEKIRDGERATSARGVWSLSEFPSVSPLQFPLICWNYPISPSLYFGENAFYLNSTHTTNQSLKCATFRGVSPGGAQLHPEMASPFRVESARLHAEKREHEPYRLNRNNTLTVAEKTQNGRTANHENAWGGPTYTELITEAILSTRDHRMTLSQIYDWITENVEYFRERKNFTSARGWKVCQINIVKFVTFSFVYV